MNNGGSSPTGNTLIVVVGVGILLLSLLCLGTWPALLRLCTWQNNTGETSSETNTAALHHASISCFGRTLAKAQNRHPCHVYLDYALAYFVASAVPILLEMSRESNHTHSLPLASVSVLGGSLLSVGNLCMQWSTAVFGAPLTTVLALQASLTVVLGTSINYLLEPQKTAHPDRLASGVVCFLLAIGFASRAQTMYQERNNSNKSSTTDMMGMASLTTLTQVPATTRRRGDYHECGEIEIETLDSFRVEQKPEALVEGNNNTDEGNVTLNVMVVPSEHHDRVRTGLCIAIAGGVCFGFFSPAMNIAVNDPFDWHPNNGGLSVARSNMWFAAAFVVCSIVGNVLLISILDTSTQASSNSLCAYFCPCSFSEKRLALLAGILCAIGNVLQFQGGHLAGFAASDLVQAFPLIATIWDVKVFGEFRHMTKHVLVALIIMYSSYLMGIVLLALSIAV